MTGILKIIEVKLGWIKYMYIYIYIYIYVCVCVCIYMIYNVYSM